MHIVVDDVKWNIRFFPNVFKDLFEPLKYLII